MHGNVKVTGHIVQPSDQRAKVLIEEVRTAQTLACEHVRTQASWARGFQHVVALVSFCRPTSNSLSPTEKHFNIPNYHPQEMIPNNPRNPEQKNKTMAEKLRTWRVL